MRISAALLACALFLASSAAAQQASDDEMRVVNAIVEHYDAEAIRFWADVRRRPGTETMRGAADDLKVSRLAVALTTIQPVPVTREDMQNIIRSVPSALRAAYGRRQGKVTLAWLQSRRDLLLVPPPWGVHVDPEAFYAKFPSARGFLRLSIPAVRGDEALIYAQLMMVYSEVGQVHYLRKVGGRWQEQWGLTVVDVPGC